MYFMVLGAAEPIFLPFGHEKSKISYQHYQVVLDPTTIKQSLNVVAWVKVDFSFT